MIFRVKHEIGIKRVSARDIDILCYNRHSNLLGAVSLLSRLLLLLVVLVVLILLLLVLAAVLRGPGPV